MYRVEIISNKSVEEDIIESIESYVENFMYTTVPFVYGSGKNNKKLGNPTWPESNFLMIIYASEEEYSIIKKVIKSIKEKFPREGIKMFAIKSEDL